jgi:capping protein alpha
LTLQEANDAQDVELDVETESFRSALQASALSYLSSHYHDGVASVFSSNGSTTEFVLQIVANKYNPANYWSGRWRSEYIVDLGQKTITGKILVTVHYYEQGNVQLSTSHTASISLPPPIASATPPSSVTSKIMALIGDEESKYQTALSDSYHEMKERTFKGLRRALPMTKQKIDWEKVCFPHSRLWPLDLGLSWY